MLEEILDEKKKLIHVIDVKKIPKTGDFILKRNDMTIVKCNDNNPIHYSSFNNENKLLLCSQRIDLLSQD
jgi:hypothetical protein